MDTCCSIHPGDYDPCDFYARTERRARKPHTCDECTRDIKPGEDYEAVSMVADGRWSSWKTCWFCVALVRDYCGGTQIHGELAELLWDCLDYDLVADRFLGEDS